MKTSDTAISRYIYSHTQRGYLRQAKGTIVTRIFKPGKIGHSALLVLNQQKFRYPVKPSRPSLY